jgi:hypothetical protein
MGGFRNLPVVDATCETLKSHPPFDIRENVSGRLCDH